MNWTITDAYCGIGSWACRDKLLPGTPAETLAVLDQCGVSQALVYGNLVHQWASAVEVNESLVAAAAGCGRFLPAFVLAPLPQFRRSGVEVFADTMRKAGARAAWLWPQGGKQSHGLWTWLMGDIYSFCSEARLPLLLPIDAAGPDLVHSICSEFPRLRVVLAGLDYRADVWLTPLLRLHDSLHACTGPTYAPPLGVEQFVRRFGPERLVFGSGLPFFSPGGLVSYVAYADVSDDDKAAIFSGNIERLLEEVQL